MYNSAPLLDKSESSDSNDITPLLLKWVGIVRGCWKWFLLSLIVALAVGYVVLQSRTRYYRAQAVVLVEDTEENGGQVRGFRLRRLQSNNLLQLGGVSATGNLDNEMFILSSRRLMEQVVQRLQLHTDYRSRQGLHEVTLYDETPLRVEFLQDAPQHDHCRATIEADGSVLLTDFEGRPHLTSEQKQAQIRLRPGQQARTPIGPLKVHFTEEWKNFPKGKASMCTTTPSHAPPNSISSASSPKLIASRAP